MCVSFAFNGFESGAVSYLTSLGGPTSHAETEELEPVPPGAWLTFETGSLGDTFRLCRLHELYWSFTLSVVGDALTGRLGCADSPGISTDRAA